MVRVEADIDILPVVNALKRFPTEATRQTGNALRDIGIFHTRRMSRGQFTGYTGASPPNRLQSRSGALRRSLGWRVMGRHMIGRLELRMFAGTPYARIQEFGGTIRPTRSQFLTVPLPNALTSAGVLKGDLRIRRAGESFVTDRGPTYIFRSQQGNLLIGVRGEKTGDGRPIPYYVLKRSVTIPEGRFGFIRTYRERTARFVNARFVKVLRDTVAKTSRQQR